MNHTNETYRTTNRQTNHDVEHTQLLASSRRHFAITGGDCLPLTTDHSRVPSAKTGELHRALHPS